MDAAMTTGSPTTTFTDVEVDGQRVDVTVADGRIAEVGRSLPRIGDHRVDGGGAALIPGLHDHHLHLLAMAAARHSLDLAGCSGATDADAAITAAHRAHLPGRWLRVVGADERHGSFERQRLDHLAPGRCVRVQHRSGAAWSVSTAGVAALATEGVVLAEVPQDGWIHRHDGDLRRGWDDEPLDLGPIGWQLAAAGVTGVTDATPYEDDGGFAVLAAACQRGALPQHVMVTGSPRLAGQPPPHPLTSGPVKVIVADEALPSPDELIEAFRQARAAGRPVAVHCVTRIGLVLALIAWDEIGALEGDRIEHGSVIPIELVERIGDHGLRVVTQPAFIAERGDRYLDEVEPDDVPHLYRCASLIDAAIDVGGSTDAPFGPADPWLAIATAITRATGSGRCVGGHEGLAPRRALDLFLGRPTHPGGPARRIEPGAPADLCLLEGPLDDILRAPSADRVAGCWIGGTPVAGAVDSVPPHA